jgi:hypothetical protein
MLNLGEKLRSLDGMNVEQRRVLVQIARKEHAVFWAEWHPFRCTYEGDADGLAFWHVVDLIDRPSDPDGTRGLFAKFMQLQPDTLIVDIASGTQTTTLEVLLKHTSSLAGYVAIEPAESSMNLHQNFHQNGHGHLIEHIPWDFWHGFPAKQIADIARQRNAKKVAVMTYWGATYLPKEEIRQWVTEALTVADSVYINMLTHGKFEPEVLKQRYMPLLLNLLMSKKISLSEAIRALRAIKKMSRFGFEFSKLMPLWTSQEIRDMLSDICVIKREKLDPMWGQTAFIELAPKHG